MACAAVFPSDTVISMRLPGSTSIFTAEIWAIVKAGTSLVWDGDTKVCGVFFKPLPIGTLFLLGTQPCWHEGYFAEFTLELPRANVGVSYNDFKKKINHYILSTWQDDWNGAAANKQRG